MAPDYTPAEKKPCSKRLAIPAAFPNKKLSITASAFKKLSRASVPRETTSKEPSQQVAGPALGGVQLHEILPVFQQEGQSGEVLPLAFYL